MEQTSGSSSSVSLNRTAALRAPSPHERETPMEGRINPVADVAGRKAPGNVAFAREDAYASSLPAFGIERDKPPLDGGGAHFGSLSPTIQAGDPTLAKPLDLVLAAAASRSVWKSPQAGQPLVLPFPEHDDMEPERHSPVFKA